MKTKTKNSYSFKSKVWLWPGDLPWHFVSLDKKMSKQIKDLYGPKKYGAGFVKIKATIGTNSWTTALFPYKKQEIYLISIKKNIRQKEGILNGDTIAIKFDVL